MLPDIFLMLFRVQIFIASSKFCGMPTEVENWSDKRSHIWCVKDMNNGEESGCLRDSYGEWIGAFKN